MITYKLVHSNTHWYVGAYNDVEAKRIAKHVGAAKVYRHDGTRRIGGHLITSWKQLNAKL